MHEGSWGDTWVAQKCLLACRDKPIMRVAASGSSRVWSQAPCTPAALSLFMIGSWTLNKSLNYQHGGKSGSFVGNADFRELSDTKKMVLAYDESGVATFEPDNEQFNARMQLLYDCSSESEVRVLFDEAKTTSSGKPRLAGGRFFHTIDWTSRPPKFSHPCGPDMYYGQLIVTGPDTFVLDWRVEGPRKRGSVVSRFTRSPKRKTGR